LLGLLAWTLTCGGVAQIGLTLRLECRR